MKITGTECIFLQHPKKQKKPNDTHKKNVSSLKRESLIFIFHQMKHLKRSNSDSLEKESVKNANGMCLDTPVVLCDSDEVEHVLQPQGAPVLRMGTNIAARNPDVEIAALVLKDVPLTPESFRDLAKENDWYRFPFMVLQVGPPGFSTVPYTSTKKNSPISAQRRDEWCEGLEFPRDAGMGGSEELNRLL